MRDKIQNTLKISCSGIDLTAVSNIEFYVRQKGFFGCYVPAVISPSEMAVIIPLQDAMKLEPGKASLQFAYKDENGTPRASGIVTRTVGELLKEAGYDPI